MSRWSPSYHTACQIQKKILSAMGLEFLQSGQTPKPIEKGPPLTPGELSSLSKAWDTLEDRKRILRFKPLPKAQDVPIKKGAARPPRATFQE